jgi:hypothetical protein
MGGRNSLLRGRPRLPLGAEVSGTGHLFSVLPQQKCRRSNQHDKLVTNTASNIRYGPYITTMRVFAQPIYYFRFSSLIRQLNNRRGRRMLESGSFYDRADTGHGVALDAVELARRHRRTGVTEQSRAPATRCFEVSRP